MVVIYNEFRTQVVACYWWLDDVDWGDQEDLIFEYLGYFASLIDMKTTDDQFYLSVRNLCTSLKTVLPGKPTGPLNKFTTRLNDILAAYPRKV